jgi:transcriptional regulator with XRE-family HTH domain
LDPNIADPLSEPTYNRRIWALYLARKYTRQSFADAMGVGYNMVANWDHGRFAMSLVNFIRAAEVLGVSMDELAHGKQARHLGEVERVLSTVEIRALMSELHATDEAIEAFGEHELSPRYRNQPMTRTYVSAFVAAYMAARDDGKSRERARQRACNDALNARAKAAAVDAGRLPARTAPPPPVLKKKPRKPRNKLALGAPQPITGVTKRPTA